MITCSPERDQIVAEFEIKGTVNRSDLSKMFEEVLDEANDDGERELTWCVRPAIIARRDGVIVPLLEMTVAEITICGRARRYD